MCHSFNFFARQTKKEFPFFPVGRHGSEPSPEPSPCKLEGIFGKRDASGRVGGGRQKKGKKDVQKKVDSNLTTK